MSWYTCIHTGVIGTVASRMLGFEAGLDMCIDECVDMCVDIVEACV